MSKISSPNAGDDLGWEKELIRVAPPGSVLEDDDLLKKLVFVELDVVAICDREADSISN
jgi:hypothetical protein